MTPHEIKKFSANRASRYAEAGHQTLHEQSGFETNYLARFSKGEGWVSGQSGTDPDKGGNEWRGHLKSAASYIQQALAGVNDNNLGNQLRDVLATVNGLTQVSTDDVPKAKVNKDGSTEPMKHIASNVKSRGGQPHPKGGQATPAERLENPDLFETKVARLTSRILHKM